MKKSTFAFATLTQQHVKYKNIGLYIGDLLSQSINLAKYGSGINEIFCLYVTKALNKKLLKDMATYKAIEKQLEVHVAVADYQLNQYSEQDTLQIMAELFLESVSYSPQFQVKDFDWKSFYIDCATVFAEEGWMVWKG